MSFVGRRNVVVFSAIVAGATMLPGASEALRAAPLETPATLTADRAIDPAMNVAPAPVLDVAPEALEGPADLSSSAPTGFSRTAALDADLECIAKVVYHEARGQPREGQLAVAQTIMHRVASGRFAPTPCAVANQPGQYFQTSAYNPPRGNSAWDAAVEVARAARDGTAQDVAQGAMFFQAVAHAPRAMGSRQRVATIGGHVFYR